MKQEPLELRWLRSRGAASDRVAPEQRSVADSVSGKITRIEGTSSEGWARIVLALAAGLALCVSAWWAFRVAGAGDPFAELGSAFRVLPR